MEQKQLNECVRVWSKMYETEHGAPTKQQVAEVRSLYKALYHNPNDYNFNNKPTVRRGYDITRHYSYNPVNSSYWERYDGEDSEYSDLMPAVRTKKGEIYMLSIEPRSYDTATNEEGMVRGINENIIRPSNSRFDLIANKWAPEGTRKNHITHCLLVRFKPHIINALRVNSSHWALSYSSNGKRPAWIDWSAFVDIVHQEATDEFATTFNIEIENTKHNTKEIENELKEMMV
tara:strand:- start:1131 stop:1826 length:696 start_codon:yes stop_codon:yes gene_type:complete